MNLTKFCGGEDFFDWDKILNSSYPKLSNCFENTVLDITPCVFLFVFGLPYLLVHYNSTEPPIPKSKLFFIKQALILVLWLMAWIRLIHTKSDHSSGAQVATAAIVSPSLVGMGMTLTSLFVYFDQSKGIRSSGLLSCFWTLYLVFWTLTLKNQMELIQGDEPLTDDEKWSCGIFFISYICVILLFLLSFFADNPPSQRDDLISGQGNDSVVFYEETNLRLKPCPERTSSFFSQMTFEWLTSLVWSGYKRPLVDNDLFDLNKADKAGRISRRFYKIWQEEAGKYRPTSRSDSVATSVRGDYEEQALIESGNKREGPSLVKALFKAFGPHFILSSLLKVLNDLLIFVNPLLLKGLIRFTGVETAPSWQGYFLAMLMFVAAIFQNVVLQQYFHVCFVCGMRLRSGIVAAVFRKALVLSNYARTQISVPEMVSLMTVDAQRFMDLTSYINTLWSGPFQIILATIFLWQLLGPATLAGLGVMILLLPVNAFIAKKAQKLQVEQMKEKDHRIKLMHEILSGMKLLKMYTWELWFRDKVTDIRDKELKVLKNAAFLNAAASFTWTCAPFLVSLTTFGVYVLSDKHHVLDAEKAFVSISLFNIIQFPLIMLPVMTSSLEQARVSLDRLCKFLSTEEMDAGLVDHTPGPGPAISIDNGTFAWSGEAPVFQNISLSVNKGSLVAVVGQTGSGKSSLISSLLGEMDKLTGSVSVKGSVAYVSQRPWIQSTSARDNIVFTKPLDPGVYRDTVDACELIKDFDALPAGDRTRIGERGNKLSIAQKQRLSIARAVYQNAQVYLFDDPLAKMDALTGKHIFDYVIGPKGCLKKKPKLVPDGSDFRASRWEDKEVTIFVSTFKHGVCLAKAPTYITRLLVTHGVAYLPQMDQIIVLVDGKVSEVGTYRELLARNGDFTNFLNNHANTNDYVSCDEDEIAASPSMSSVTDDDSLEPAIQTEATAASVARRQFQRQLSRQSMSHALTFRKKKTSASGSSDLPIKTSQARLIVADTAPAESMKMSVLVSYMRSVGFPVCFVIVAAYVVANVFAVYSSVWISEWASDPISPNGTRNNTIFRLEIYGLLGVTRAFFVLFSSFALSSGTVLASSHLHFKMLDCIVQAPMAFFYANPLGKVLNRFSKDIFTIDEVLPRSLASFARTFFMTLATLFVIIFCTPLFTAVVVPIFLLYWCVQRFYIQTSRQLKRLESISRPPIYVHFNETLAGVSTIRAFKLEKNFMGQNENKIDMNHTSYYPNIVSNRWLALRLEVVGNLIVLFAAIFAVFAKEKVTPGIVGLSVSYAMQVTSIMNWVVRTATEVQTNIASVEKVEEYSEIDQEPLLPMEIDQPSQDWPIGGEIVFQNYSAKYRPQLRFAVREINVHIERGEKIGVFGLAGAGKSSLILALFRIIEAAEGQIKIDGLDISKMGLHSLRSKLSIIPQNPILFSGTLRTNLDPLESYTDLQLWEALELCHLKEFVNSLPDKLEHPISEKGGNLNIGQRQLVCLARNLLRKSKILILDETVVDLATDNIIQATIDEQFSTSTIFMVTHYFNTMMKCTKVLVLESGRVVEFDTPPNLLDLRGTFFAMARRAGLA